MADWIKLTMKFPGKCLECGKPIPKGQPGMWSRGVGVKHEECAVDSSTTLGDTPDHPSNKILCAVCGRLAGCQECELADNCDIPNVSSICLCPTCSQKTDVMDAYYKSISSKYPAL